MQTPILFWRPGPTLKLSPAEVARELLWGEEVEALIDLPIREIIDRLKAEFPNHEEKSGLLTAQAPPGSFQATWTWQHIRLELHAQQPPHPLGEGWGEGPHAPDDTPTIDSLRQHVIDTIESFDCMAYEPKPNHP